MNDRAPDAVQADSVVDASHPWLGLASFSEETRAYFYGREEEVAELARRVQRKLLTVLFGQSGLGKTSILRAGLVPRLREQGICPVYVRIDYGPDAPAAAEQIKDAVMRETALAGSWTRAGVAAADESLWEFFHHRDDVLRDAAGQILTPLLIFDQFEEIFTLAQSDDAGRARAARFLEALAELAENRPSAALEARLEEDDEAVARFDFARSDYRILITLREDYLAHLESLKTAMPSITQNRMRLAPMTGQQALAAVLRPGGRLVSEEVAQAVVRFVAGGAELAHAQVEPSLLSLICRELNDKRVADGRDTISLDLLAGSHAAILSDFYERALADQPQAVRVAIEDLLLTSSGYRENVAEERVLDVLRSALSPTGISTDRSHAAGLEEARGVLALLVNRRLLRIEDRLDIRRVELTHDVLCGVVQHSRALRQEREKQAQAERALAVQREREAATRQALRRARRTVAVCVVLTVVAVGASAVGYIGMRRAQDTQALADRSRGEAESLMAYLLDDFYGELLPVGRLAMLDGLTRRTVAYYDGLPAAARTGTTNANRARALLLNGEVQLRLGNIAAADRLAQAAIAQMQPMIDAGAASDLQQMTYARAFHLRGDAYTKQANFHAAGPLIERAVAIARPLAIKPDAAMRTRLDYAVFQTRLGWNNMRSSNYDAARVNLAAAQGVLGTAEQRRTNVPMMVAYSQASQWMVELLARFDRKDYGAAEALARETVASVTAVLRQQPNHVQAASIRNAVTFMQAYYAMEQRLPGRALEIADTALPWLEDGFRVDPSSESARDTLSLALGSRDKALARLGRDSEALAGDGREMSLYRQKSASIYQIANLVGHAEVTGKIHAERGDLMALEPILLRIRQWSAILAKELPREYAPSFVYNYATRAFDLRVSAGDPTATAAEADRLVGEGETLLKSNTIARSSDITKYGIANSALAAARLASAAGDDRKAEAEYSRGINYLRQVGSTEIDNADYIIERAFSLARLQRAEEAMTALAPELAALRAAMARGSDDPFLRQDLAKALLVSAICGPAHARADLREALALLASMPASLQRYRSVQLWRERIEKALRQPAGPASV